MLENETKQTQDDSTFEIEDRATEDHGYWNVRTRESFPHKTYIPGHHSRGRSDGSVWPRASLSRLSLQNDKRQQRGTYDPRVLEHILDSLQVSLSLVRKHRFSGEVGNLVGRLPSLLRPTHPLGTLPCPQGRRRPVSKRDPSRCSTLKTSSYTFST